MNDDKEANIFCTFVSSNEECRKSKHLCIEQNDEIREKRIFRRLRNQSNNCFACTLRSGKPTLSRRKRLLNKALRKSSHHAHNYNDYQRNRRNRQTLLTGTIAMVTLFAVLQIIYNDNIFVMAATPSTQGAGFLRQVKIIGRVFKFLIWSLMSFLFIFIITFALLWINTSRKTLTLTWDNLKGKAHDNKEKKIWINGFKGGIMQKKHAYADILSKAIQCRTISYDPFDEVETDYKELLNLHQHLKKSFPLVHKHFPPAIINEYSLLFKIPGSDPELKPFMFCSHMDVVPAPNFDQSWTYEPFSGKIVGGVIWGRGAIDNKHNIIGQLGAVEELLANSVPMKRTLYIAIGHDEEIYGINGAAKIAEHLLERNINFEYILDEGTMMVSNVLPGFRDNVGLISNAEKGHIIVEMSVTGPGGHSSMPPIKGESPVSIMAKAMSKIEQNPMPAHFGKNSSLRLLFEFVASKLSFPMNVICSNFWLLEPLMKLIILNSSNGAAASIRTTSAITKLQGGTKLNVLPNQVKAYINHRVHPLDTPESVLAFDKKVVDDERIQLRILDSFTTNPSPISSTDSHAFQTIQSCIKTVFNIVSGPSLMIGNTDTRWYWKLSENIYRFSPLRIAIDDLSMFHGVNERIEVDALAEMIYFYCMLIQMGAVDPRFLPH